MNKLVLNAVKIHLIVYFIFVFIDINFLMYLDIGGIAKKFVLLFNGPKQVYEGIIEYRDLELGNTFVMYFFVNFFIFLFCVIYSFTSNNFENLSKNKAMDVKVINMIFALFMVVLLFIYLLQFNNVNSGSIAHRNPIIFGKFFLFRDGVLFSSGTIISIVLIYLWRVRNFSSSAEEG